MTQSSQLVSLPRAVQCHMVQWCEDTSGLALRACCRALRQLVDSEAVGGVRMRCGLVRIQRAFPEYKAVIDCKPACFPERLRRLNGLWRNALKETSTIGLGLAIEAEPLWRVEVIFRPPYSCSRYRIEEAFRRAAYQGSGDLVRVIAETLVGPAPLKPEDENTLIDGLVYAGKEKCQLYVRALKKSAHGGILNWAATEGDTLVRLYQKPSSDLIVAEYFMRRKPLQQKQ
jgi:hypothetical protein